MGDLYFAVLAAMVFVAATLFHITKPKGPVWWDGKGQTMLQVFFLYLDGVFSLAFGLYVAWLLVTTGALWEVVVVGIGFVLAFMVYWRSSHRYEQEHTLWHIAVAVLSIVPLV